MSFQLPVDIDPTVDLQKYLVLLFVTQHTPIDRASVIDWDIYWADFDHTMIAVYVTTRPYSLWEVVLDCADGSWNVRSVLRDPDPLALDRSN